MPALGDKTRRAGAELEGTLAMRRHQLFVRTLRGRTSQEVFR